MINDIKIIKTILLILSCVVFFVIGIFISFIIMVDKVYAQSYNYDNALLYTKNNLSPNYTLRWPWYRQAIGDIYGDTSNGNITNYRIITDNISAGDYTLYMNFHWEYGNYSTGLSTSNIKVYWGNSENSITNEIQASKQLTSISQQPGTEWPNSQDYIFKVDFDFSTAHYVRIEIQDFAYQSNITITDFNIYDNNEAPSQEQNDWETMIQNANYNTDRTISNDNRNTQNIITNQNGNTQSVINNQNQNSQNIINNQNENTQKVNTNIKDGLLDCGMNLVSNSDLSIGAINIANGNNATNNHYARSIFIPVKKVKYNFYINEPYILDVVFYYQDGTYSTYGSFKSTTGNFTVADNITDIRFRICKLDTSINNCDGSYIFTNSDLTNIRLRIWSEDVCTSKLDNLNDNVNDVNNSVNDVNNSVNNLNNSITNSNVSVGSNDINSMNNNIATNSVISDLLLLPVSLFQNILNSVNGTCTSFNLGSLFGKNLTMPCINLQNRLGSTLYNVIDILISGFFVLSIRKKFVDIFNNITSLKDGGNELE